MKLEQVTFGSGEIHPALWARNDLAFDDSGLSLGLNVIVRKTGGMVKRNGTEYVADAYDDDEVSRLIPYDFGLGQTYIFEMSHLKMRILRDGGVLQNGGSDIVLTTPWTRDDIFELKVAAYRDTIYFAHRDYQLRKVIRTSDTSWSISAVSLSISQAAPTSPSVSFTDDDNTAARGVRYKITAVSDEGEESLPDGGFRQLRYGGHAHL